VTAVWVVEDRVELANPWHDETGRFARTGGAGARSVPTKGYVPKEGEGAGGGGTGADWKPTREVKASEGGGGYEVTAADGAAIKMTGDAEAFSPEQRANILNAVADAHDFMPVPGGPPVVHVVDSSGFPKGTDGLANAMVNRADPHTILMNGEKMMPGELILGGKLGVEVIGQEPGTEPRWGIPIVAGGEHSRGVNDREVMPTGVGMPHEAYIATHEYGHSLTLSTVPAQVAHDAFQATGARSLQGRSPRAKELGVDNWHMTETAKVDFTEFAGEVAAEWVLSKGRTTSPETLLFAEMAGWR
jgi:hypothetical protein